jgi:hypothetical protein
VTAALVQRLLVLGAVALLCALATVAVLERRKADPPAAPSGAVAPGGWYDALAASRGPAGDAERTTCGLVLTARSYGVTHPVLPCGAKIIVRFREEAVLTEVIDNKLRSASRQFELTEALAREIGLDGTQQVEWRFATSPSG